jgi:hypothetical protein
VSTRSSSLGDPGQGLPDLRLIPLGLLCVLILGAGVNGAGKVFRDLAAPAPPQQQSFLFHGDPAPRPGPPVVPAAPGARRMPDFPVRTLEGGAATVYGPDRIAPPIMTVFLAYCTDCADAAAYFPRLAAMVQASGDEPVVNLAYMGQPGVVRSYLAGKDFGGPCYLDHDGAATRSLGIGTFTVYLLERDGTIAFQGSPAAAEPRLAEHLARRKAALGAPVAAAP